MPLIFFGVVLLVSIAVVFALQNAAVVPVAFLFWRFELSLALLLLLVFVLGAAASSFALLPSRLRQRRLIAEQKRAINALGDNIAEDKKIFKPSKFVS